jgi:type IV pilus assembly protein PilM
MNNKPPFFYTDKPLFGFDIGNGSLKVMQLQTTRKGMVIVGYGTTNLDRKAFENGAIKDLKSVSTAIRGLFKSHLVGEITTNRIAMAIPSYRTFTRLIQLPKLTDAELREAVQLAVEQYAPRPLTDLYLDYTVTRQTADSRELFVVATPKKIVDSHLALARSLGLETVSIEPAITACARLFARDNRSKSTSVIIDIGSLTADISIYDRSILATSTVPAGGLVFTDAIKKRLNINQDEAGFIKTKYGLDTSMTQKQIREALDPALQKIMTEVRRMIRFYEERYRPENHIDQIVMLGGGANMPGLANYLTDQLKAPVRTHNHPWAIFDSGGLKPPVAADRLMYITAAGLGLLNPKEAFTDD